MLRLTLRTLLAYLDDTLEPTQARQIGQKVAESDLAQATVERIKTVTRRRRLTAPAVETDNPTADPNTIAEYLDNVLPADQLAEVEQSALDDDVMLAELAASHQILTLVLGEPARVPPTARRRMYRLVRGPESLPYRRPTEAGVPVAGVAPSADADDAEDDVLGAVFGPRTALWFAGILVLVGLLGLAVWLAVPSPPPLPAQGYIRVAGPAPPDVSPAVKPIDKKPAGPDPDPKTVTPALPPDLGPAPVPPAKDGEPQMAPAPRVVAAPTPPPPAKEPDTERRLIAKADKPAEPLLYRKRDTARWERANAAEPRLQTADELLALPGFHPELLLDSGVRLVLWGNLPEFLNVAVAESRVTLHVPVAGLEADFTLRAGRVFVTAPTARGPTTVRVRLLEETWDVTLADATTEVAIDLVGEPAKGPMFDREFAEAPRAVAYFGVVRGQASLRTGFAPAANLAEGAKYKWDSKAGRPGPAPPDDADEAPPLVDRWKKRIPLTPEARPITDAVNEMQKRAAAGQGPFDVDLEATVKDTREPAPRRAVAAWMLAATDSRSALIDALEADVPAIRDAAAKAARHWVAGEPGREAAFAQALAMKAAWNDDARLQAVALLRGGVRPTGDAADRLFGLLKFDKLAVRELARMQLARFDPTGAKEVGYDAAATAERREAQSGQWQRSWKKREGKMKE